MYLRMVCITNSRTAKPAISRANNANLHRTNERCIGRRTRGRFHRQHRSRSQIQQRVQSRARRKAEGNDGTRRCVFILFSKPNPNANPPPDEPMPNAPDEPPDSADDSYPIDGPRPAEPQPPEATVLVSSGRRRGRRKVMKKKTTKDDEGYLGAFSHIINPIPTYALPNFKL